MKRKRKLKKIPKIIIITLIILVLLFLGYKTYSKHLNNNPKEPNNQQKEPTEPVEKHYEASLIAVGDNLIHSSLYRDANRHAGGNGYGTDAFDFKPMLTYIKEIVKNYDIGYYNQETILGGTELGLSDYPVFNSPYEAGDAMLDAGFNLVSLATNHTVDRGKSAVENSCKYWNSKKDILTAGSYCSTEERNEIKIAEKNNITYTMLNYTYGTNGMPVSNDYLVNIWPTDTDNINNPEKDTKYQAYKEQVKKDIESIRDKVDVLMVAMHWGIEYNFDINSYQEDAAKFLSSLGVDIIIGTHPHVVEPVTWIDNTLVIYSLGNFLSAHEVVNIANRVGLMTSIDITKKVNGDNKEITLSNLSNDLIYTYHNNYTNFKIIPFSNKDIYNYLDNADEIYNKYSSIVKKLDNNINVLELPA